ncbi:MFS transporter [Ectopseudomonas mendocina]|uniref:MFS transporter n=1 Tax=Ectopseudomonas mendocina TaxID=300 RepID=A0ABZ2RM95_ECTME
MKLPGSPFFWVSFAMIVGGMSTALISPLYPLYQIEWDLLVSQVSLIYVVYMFGALGCLLFLGRLADRIGFRKVLVAGLVLMLLGTGLTVAAWDIYSLLCSRFIVGVAASLLTTSGTGYLLGSSEPDSLPRVSTITSVLVTIGFGLGPLLGGIIGQWLAYPLITAYIPVLVLGTLALYALLTQVPSLKITQAGPVAHWLKSCLPRLTWPAHSSSGVFLLICWFPFVAFSVFGLYASIAPLFLEKMVSWHGPFVGGAAIALILFISASMQVACRQLHIHINGMWGMLAMAMSNALMIINLHLGSSLVFVSGVLLAAIGHGMVMLAGASMVNRLALPHNRAGMFATFWVAGYIGAIGPMMGMGWIADHWGISTSVTVFCSSIILIAVVHALFTRRHPGLRAVQG